MRSTGWLVLLGVLGCAYTPPIRGLHAGMPDRVGRGQLEVGGTAGGFSTGNTVTAPTTGGPHVAYGLNDTVVLEAGANLNFVDALWATTWAGVRLVRAVRLVGEVRLVGDLELGAGLGLGGRLKHESAPPRWAERPNWGLYEGLGVGLRWRWLGAFLRGRLDASAGNDAPSTLWPSAVLGVEARAGPVVFALASGAGGWWNPEMSFVGFWFYQAQVALVFDVLPRAGSGVTSPP